MPLGLQPDGLSVVLVSTRNPLNIGAAARAMSNFGFSELRLVSPWGPSFREAKSAVGASHILAEAKEYKKIADAVADCTLVVGTTAKRNRELQHHVHDLQLGATLIRKHLHASPKKPHGGVALLFGSEKRGLSNADLSHCHWLVHIPTHEEHPSMNLGQAVAVCLYEVAQKQPSRAPMKQTEPATSGTVDRLASVLLDALERSGYFSGDQPGRREEKLQRLIRRARFNNSDAEQWLGMLRKVLWKLRRENM